MPTGLVYDERCLNHDNGSDLIDSRAQSWLDVAHPESPDRIARTMRVLEGSGVLSSLARVPARPATDEDLMLVHSRAHVNAIRAACESGKLTSAGPGARASGASWEPALLSAGGAVSALDWVLEGTGRNAYVLLRPPGHHASRDTAMGYCLFNNVAICARHAQRRHGLGRVAIVDWDVHHGNGTQDVFYEDPEVLFVSLHQDGLYPPTSGTSSEVGEGAGRGTTLNVPLPAGTDDAGYLEALDRIILPAVRAHRPELILVSAGQDPAGLDPLGRMSMTTEGFRAMTARVRSLAAELCEDRVVVIQEGGYSRDHLPFCVLAIVEELAGLPPSLIGDPMDSMSADD